jgi:beta-lactamase class A
MNPNINQYVLTYQSPTDSALQMGLERVDAAFRRQFGLTTNQSAVGLLDLNTLRLALIHPDREEYAASIPKIGILLAYFQLHPQAAASLDRQTRQDLGLMIKASDNEMAARFSRELGLKQIQAVLDAYHFYDPNHGGGIWVGKHYGQGGERYGDPVGDHSHAARFLRHQRSLTLTTSSSKGLPDATCRSSESLERGRIGGTIRQW